MAPFEGMGERIVRLREALGLQQSAAARVCEIDPQKLATAEKNADSRASTVAALARGLAAPADYFLGLLTPEQEDEIVARARDSGKDASALLKEQRLFDRVHALENGTGISVNAPVTRSLAERLDAVEAAMPPADFRQSIEVRLSLLETAATRVKALDDALAILLSAESLPETLRARAREALAPSQSDQP